MRKLLEEFFSKSYRKSLQLNAIKRLENTVELNNEKLKENLSKEQRVRLLRIHDAKNLITEEYGSNCFIEGFKLGLKIGYESNKD